MMAIEKPVEQTTRITCEENGKLIAKADQQGLWIWCLYHKRAEFVSKERCIEAWTKGESVVHHENSVS
jgi:hypothetical protein